MNKHKVTIIVPCFNASEYIENCLLSCNSQSYENKEIIVVDNESTDDSLSKIIKLKEEKIPDLIISTEKNIFPFSWEEPVTKAWTLMTGDFFTIVGADDILHPEYISQCVSHMLSENCLVMQSPIYLFDTIKDNTLYVKSTLGGATFKNLNEFKKQLLQYCCVASPSVFYSSKILKNYTVKFKSDLYLGSCDYYLYCSLADQGIIINSAPKPLGYFYRIHKNQSTNGMISLGSKHIEIDNSIRNEFRSRWNFNI